MAGNPSKDKLRGTEGQSPQDLLNQSFDHDGFHTLVSQLVGSPDGVNQYSAKVNADGSVNAKVTSGLVPVAHDEIVLTYVPSGNGVGEIATVVYKLATVTVATLTLSYNSNNKLVGVVRT